MTDNNYGECMRRENFLINLYVPEGLFMVEPFLLDRATEIHLFSEVIWQIMVCMYYHKYNVKVFRGS
jgi:hypothetical protein